MSESKNHPGELREEIRALIILGNLEGVKTLYTQHAATTFASYTALDELDDIIGTHDDLQEIWKILGLAASRDQWATILFDRIATGEDLINFVHFKQWSENISVGQIVQKFTQVRPTAKDWCAHYEFTTPHECEVDSFGVILRMLEATEGRFEDWLKLHDITNHDYMEITPVGEMTWGKLQVDPMDILFRRVCVRKMEEILARDNPFKT